MSEYANQWKAAKTRFETESGASKPAEKGKVLFVEYRKSTHIESTLEKLDKALKGAEQIDTAPAGVIPAAEKLVAALKKHGDAYMQKLNSEVAKEKNAKGKTDLLRSLKILRAALDVILKTSQNELNRAKATVKAKAQMYDDRVQEVFRTMTAMRTGIEQNAAKALAISQNLLQNPTPKAFNAAFPGAARQLTQQVGNLYKYAFPLELTGRSAETTLQHLDREPRLLMKCMELEKAVKQCKAELKNFSNETGTDPSNCTLWKMANSPIQYPETADAATVKRGIKNFATQVKETLKYAKLLKQAGL